MVCSILNRHVEFVFFNEKYVIIEHLQVDVSSNIRPKLIVEIGFILRELEIECYRFISSLVGCIFARFFVDLKAYDTND